MKFADQKLMWGWAKGDWLPGYSEKGLGQQLKTPANPKKKKKNTAAATEPREEMEEEQQAAAESGQKQQQKQQQQEERRSNLSPQKLRAAKFYAKLYTQNPDT